MHGIAAVGRTVESDPDSDIGRTKILHCRKRLMLAKDVAQCPLRTNAPHTTRVNKEMSQNRNARQRCIDKDQMSTSVRFSSCSVWGSR
jgi:hypothetical protein